MKFSNLDVIGKEEFLITNRKSIKRNVFSRMVNSFFYPRNPKRIFRFYVPSYTFIRSRLFCDDVEIEMERKFTQRDLAHALYMDFLEFIRKTNDIHTIHKALKARGVSPTKIVPYQTDDVYKGVLSEEVRGFEEITVMIEHDDALKGEFLLRDMEEVYPEHGFILENILEIVYINFIEDYRKSLIKNPIKKVAQYIE